MDHFTEVKMDETLPLPVTTDTPSTPRRARIVELVAGVFDVFRRNLSAGTPPSSSSSYDDNESLPPLRDGLDVPEPGTIITSEEEGGYVEKVVVEQSWGSGTRSRLQTSESSDLEHKLESKSGEIQPIQMRAQDTEAEGQSNAYLVILIRIWLKIRHFFYPRPFDVGSEERYDDDDWYSKKTMAQLASTWLIINLGLGCASVPRPWTLIDYIFYAGFGPAFTIPVFVMVMYSWPRDHRVIYQCFVAFALWMWPLNLLINIYICAYYVPNHAGALLSCNGKDFINIFFYATAMQAIGLFGLRLERLYAAVAAALWFIISCALIIPEHTVWWRSVVNFAIFHIFLIWVHERRESSERRLYAMKVQVKIQYKALQRAQANERRTSESKHRLTSYVFHEVRVPLNSALLAAQSMEASGTVSKTLEVEFDALMGSLTMMSQVLNDVLDFNRLDSGQFELVSKPYAFHQTVRSLFIPLQMATAQKGLTLHTELDPEIDKVARCAAYRAMGERDDVIERHVVNHPDVDGVVIGDEARFRQIITNFASNACKFTPQGGSVTIKTKLVTPSADVLNESGQKNGIDRAGLSASRLAQHDYHNGNDKDELIVVRVEVTDTGCGIDQSELTGQKLFSAFVQTERGRQQGGKGTGLGLALVRNIVKLSGGRLGVKSRYHKGSTFWVELPLGVGRKALIPSTGPNVITRLDSQGSDGSMGSMGADVAEVRAAAVQNDSFGDGIDGLTRPKLTTKNSLTKVVDVAAHKASEMSSPMRSSTLMHSTIMEQAGRVDLVVDSQTPSVPLASIRASPSIMSGAPTPNTAEMSFSFHSHHSRGTPQSEESQNLSIESGDIGMEKEVEEGALSLSYNSETTAQSPSSPSTLNQPPPPAPDEELPPFHSGHGPPSSTAPDLVSASTVQRPRHIPMPSAPRFYPVQSALPASSPASSQPSPSSQPSSSQNAASLASSATTSPLSLFDNSFSRTGGYSANLNNVPNQTFLGLPPSNNLHHSKNNSLPDFSPGLSVLVVDDDGITRKMMERVLERQGCEVTTAENGRVALELILGDEWDPAMLEEIGTGADSKDQSRNGSRTHSQTVSLDYTNGIESAAPKSSEEGRWPSNSRTDSDSGLGLDSQVPSISSPGVMSRVGPRDSDSSMLAFAPSKFAVVFLDNSMPVLNGLRTVEILRRLKRRDFVVGLTGNALLPDQDEYLKAGVDIVLTKPVMQNKITYVLKEADARRQRQLALIPKS